MNRRSSLSSVLIAAVLVLAACQVPSVRPQARQPAASPSPAVPNRVVAADSKLYAGDYDGAEAAYQALIKQSVPGAAAHYSTLLAYETRVREAVAQAQAGVAVRADSDALARLTRALDWAEDIAGALQAGARALAVQPVDPLAHVFYSEALADAGRYADAERELRTAEVFSGDVYFRAELDREWANYYRNRSDKQSELNYIQLSIKEQPAFPERKLELVRYDYVNQKTDAARSILDKLIGPEGKTNYPLLLGGANSAFIGGDFDRASSLYSAALQARPTGSAAALGQAEVAVAVKRDFKSAHDLLLDTLKKDTGSGDVYRYLRYLDLLVLKTDPDAELQAIVPQPPSDLAAARKALLDRVNAFRSNVGVPPLSEDGKVAEGAEAHAYYFLFNFGRPQLQGLGIHSEDPTLPAFTGGNSLERDRHFGYGGSGAGEVINHVFTPEGSVQVWMDSVFHRFPLLARETAVAGYGEAQVGVTSIAVMDVGLSDPGKGEAIVYPTPDQPNVPASFNGGEVPDPAPAGTNYPIGYPVTLQMGLAQTLAVSAGRLLGPDGKEVPSFALEPGKGAMRANEWALLAQQPLTPGARYTVEVSGKVDAQDFSKRWSFTVGSS